MSHPVLEALRSQDASEREAACRAAADDPSAVLLCEALIESLGDENKRVVRAASDALAAIGPNSPETVSALRAALRGRDPRKRWGAAFTHARLSPPDVALIPALVEAMGSPDGDIRWAAARLMVDTGRMHPEACTVTIGLARSAEDPAVRRMATFCLRELAPDDPAAAAAMLDTSREADPQLKRAALTAMAALLDPPPAVIERLLEAIRSDPDPGVRRLSAVAFGELGSRGPERIGAELRAELRALAVATDDPDLARSLERALERLESEKLQ